MKPADLSEFWYRTIKALGQTKINPNVTEAPETFAFIPAREEG